MQRNLGSSRPAALEVEPARWLDEHGAILFRFAVLRVGDHACAEDLVQETLIKAIENVDSFRGEASVRTWLFSILKNEIARYFRSVKKQTRTLSNEKPIGLEELLHPEIDNQSFRNRLEKEEFWEAVESCFAEVPDHLLETFLQRLANPDEKVEAICEQMGIKPSNFSVRLFRTRLMLRECLERKWI